MTTDEKLTNIDNKLNLLLVLVQGNPLNSADKGLNGTIADHALRLKKTEEAQKKVAWTFAGMCLMAGYYGYKLINIFFSAIK